MRSYHHSLGPRRARLLAGGLAATARDIFVRLRTTALAAAVTALALAVLAVPATAGTTLVSGVGEFNDLCQAPVGGPPDDPGDYPPIHMSGSLDGCWYTYVSGSRLNPSGTYVEQGTEFFVGCLNGTSCGTFETIYTFTGKFTDDTFEEEIHGRCAHRIVAGTGDFEGVKGVVTFKDDVENLLFDYRGQIHLAHPGGQNDGQTATNLPATGPARSDGC